MIPDVDQDGVDDAVVYDDHLVRIQSLLRVYSGRTGQEIIRTQIPDGITRIACGNLGFHPGTQLVVENHHSYGSGVQLHVVSTRSGRIVGRFRLASEGMGSQ